MTPFRKYELVRRGRIYKIYRMKKDATGSTGEAIFESFEYEAARKKLFELNKWKYKPKKQE